MLLDAALPGIPVPAMQPCSSISRSKRPSNFQIVYYGDDRWSDAIPVEIVEHILEKFNSAPDCIRFGAVCRLWQYALLQAKRRLNPSVPLILLLPPPTDPAGIELIDITTAPTNFYKLPSTKINNNCIVVGSSFGWLVTIDHTTYHTHLFNPITTARIPLPPASALHDFNDCPSVSLEMFVYKVVLSSTPNQDCIIMAIHSRHRQLSFCRIGDLKWTNIPWINHLCNYQDMVHYKGKFYAVTQSEVVVECQFDPAPRVMEIASIPPDTSMYKKYLVESSGELLMVTRYHCFEKSVTSVFEIHRLDIPNGGKWEELTRIDGHALFLGNSSSISLPVQEAEGFYKPNFIYFLDDNWDWYKETWFRGIGVYNCENYKIHPPYSSSRSWPLPFFWFTPAPW